MKYLNRRQWLGKVAACLAMPAGGLLPNLSHAGQVEEPLSHSMVTALSAAVSDGDFPKMEFDDISERLRHLNWLGEMSKRLESRIPNFHWRIEFLETVRYESTRAGLETSLVLGLIQTESAFKQYAVSGAGALGYMQVMPFWTRLIGDGDVGKLFHMQINLRYGCVILRHYMGIEKGDMFMALGRYNGSRGKSPYPDTVYRFRERWLYEPPATVPEVAPVVATTANAS
ncbi:MAG: lytic transglycosylase domain-containing protein [Saezia sp.]